MKRTILYATILAAAASVALAQQKVSERTSLASGDVAPATDILPIVDVSAGSAGSKKITIDDLFTGWGFSAAGESLVTAADASAQRTLLDAVGLSASQTVTNKTLGSGTVITAATMTLGSDAAGDIYYRNSGGALTRLGVGTDGYVLTLASGLPSWAAAAGGGGGGLTNWTEAVNSASPNATIPVVSFTATNAATNVDAALLVKGTGSILAAIPDSLSAGGNKRGTGAVDLQLSRNAAAQVASGVNSAIIGGRRSTASGASSSVVGGATNTCGTTEGFIGGGSSNTTSAGVQNVVIGGSQNSATGNRAVVAGGLANVASGDDAVAMGDQSTASGEESVASGKFATTRGITGARAHASGNAAATGPGLAQAGTYLVRRSTSNATPTELSADGAAPAAATRIALPNSFAYKFKGQAVARESSTGDVKTWDFSGTIKRGANAAATAIVGSVTMTVKDADAGASAWTLAIDADTTNGSLRATATGEAAKAIQWLVEIETLELQ